MREKFGEDVSKSINEELSKSYPPHKDPFVKKVLHPPLEELFCKEEELSKSLPHSFDKNVIHPSLKEFSCEILPPGGLEFWYLHYLKGLSKEP